MSLTGSAPLPSVPGFELRRLLGRGAQAEVWLATDLLSAEPVALKFRSTPVGDPAAPADQAATVPPRREQAAQVREIGLLRRIDHPNIVRLRRVAQVAGGGTALVLEYAPGGSLADLIAARGRLDPGEVTSLLVPLARALAHLHERGAVHGDLAPGNVLFADDGRPLLADLGAAVVLGIGADHGLGTAGFADPHQTGAGDPAADVRSLAALGWYALTGAPPPDGVGLSPDGLGLSAEQLAERLAGTYPDPVAEPVPDLSAEPVPDLSVEPVPDPPTELFALLADCLQQDRSARPAAVDLVRTAWAAAAPAPIRMLTWIGGHDPDDVDRAAVSPTELTRRLRAAVAVEPAPDRRRSRPITLRVAGLVIAGVVPALAAGWVLAGGLADLPRSGSVAPGPVPPTASAVRPSTARPSTAAAAPGRPAEAWTAVLHQLAGGRAAAIEAGSSRALGRVDEPGSPAMAADLALIRRLAQRRVRLAGLRFELSGLRVLRQSETSVTVRVLVAASAHRQLSTRGRESTVVPAGATLPVRLVLVRSSDQATGWRVRAVLADG